MGLPLDMGGVQYIAAVAFGSIILLLVFMYLDFRFPNTRIELATTANLMITMLLGGFWHGPSWLFVIWGGLNGVGLVFYKWWKRISPWEGKQQWYWVAWTVFFTFSFITFTRIWFRSPDMATANALLHQISYNFGWEHVVAVVDNYAKVFYIMYAGLVIHWMPARMKDQVMDGFVWLPVPAKAVVTVALVFLVYQAISSELQAFICFQF
jgi:alginate O-acetyltransferase complex protein AlgI